MSVLLLPACYGVTLALWSLLRPFKDVPEGSFYFFGGVASYFAFQWVFFRPIRTYVFGHELTHALAAWMTGGHVKHFHVSKKGGSVSVTKTNFFVALAPYMIPLYSLILLGVFFGIGYFHSLRTYWPIFLWLLGLTIGFHMALTTFALRQNQPDLKTSGKFLSAVIIYLGNSASVVLMLGILFPKTVSWGQFLRLSGQQTVTAVRQIGHGIIAIPPLLGKFQMNGHVLQQSTPHTRLRPGSPPAVRPLPSATKPMADARPGPRGGRERVL